MDKGFQFMLKVDTQGINCESDEVEFCGLKVILLFSSSPLLLKVFLGAGSEAWAWEGSLKNDQPNFGHVCYYDTYSDWVPLVQVVVEKGRRRRRRGTQVRKRRRTQWRRRRNMNKKCLSKSLNRQIKVLINMKKT